MSVFLISETSVYVVQCYTQSENSKALTVKRRKQDTRMFQNATASHCDLRGEIGNMTQVHT